MTQQIINNGSAPNDGTGESLRTAFDKCNVNFTELYGLGPYQPLDGDLTSLAAAAATDSLYFRSGADTWSPVTIGSGIDFTGGTLTGTGGAAGSSEYTFSTTTSAPPASGQIRLNNATPSSATIFWINNLTQPGTDIKHYLETIPVGANIAIQDKNDSSKWAKYQVASAPIDNTTYFEISVTFVAGGSAIANNTRILFIVGAGASYQPLDADLTAIAALTGTNVIYYRSAANTWSPVIVGSNMTFSGGTLNSVAGGNVSNSGTPTNGQWAQWTDATHIQGIVTASMPFVQKSGDTMTGNLVLAYANPQFELQKTASGQGNYITGRLNTAPRWQFVLGDSTAESGSNAGSNFSLGRFNDAGAFIDTPLTITRSNGQATFAGNVVIAKASPLLIFNKSAAGQLNFFQAQTNGVPRWQMEFGDAAAESGGNAGSNFTLSRFSDGGAFIDAPFFIRRSDGVVTLGRSANSAVFDTIANVNIKHNDGALGRGISVLNVNNSLANAIIFLNAGSAVVGQINTDASSTAFVTSSDRRLKENITPFTNGREIIDQLQVHNFTWIEKGTDEIGLIAQEVEPVLPQATTPGSGEPGEAGFVPYGIDNSKIVPILIQALQEAFKEIDALKHNLPGR